MKKILLLIGAALVLLICNRKEEEIIIPNDAIRFRIIASSNEIADQALKMNIKKEILNEIIPNISTAKTSKEAKQLIEKNKEDLDHLLQQFDVSYQISNGLNYFPEKTYKGITYQAGNYDSLVITLGKGKGDNWWCVLFPPLCLLDAKEETDDVEYRSFVKELLNKA